jgi:putative addiction module killer protein
MAEVLRSSVYKKWLKNLKDPQARARIFIRTKRLASGNPGDNRFLGDISELRIDYGPGYRVYYKDTGKEIIILLCGGDKTTQQVDIAKAREIARLPIENFEE